MRTAIFSTDLQTLNQMAESFHARIAEQASLEDLESFGARMSGMIALRGSSLRDGNFWSLMLDDVRREYRRRKAADAAEVRAAVVEAERVVAAPARETYIPDGIFTTELGTIRLETVVGGALDGKRVVSYLDDNERFTGFAFYSAGRVDVWKKFKGFSAKVVTASAAMTRVSYVGRETCQEAYALKTGRCAACNRRLTVPISIHRGLGPVCAKRMAV